MPSHRIAIVGGTGPLGRGLGWRFAAAGHEVVLGSRDAQRAVTAATGLADRLGADVTTAEGGSLRGATNDDAVADADVVVVAVPYPALSSTLAQLPGLGDRPVVSCVNPLKFDADGVTAIRVAEGSAAQRIATLLPDSRVTVAFNHLSADALLSPAAPPDETVLIMGDHADDKRIVGELATAVTQRGGLDAGPLRNARLIEGFTAVLITCNRIHGGHAGIAISGI